MFLKSRTNKPCISIASFLFTGIKWKTCVVLVRILHGAFGSTHKQFCAHSVCLVCLKHFGASEYAAEGTHIIFLLFQLIGLVEIRRISFLELKCTYLFLFLLLLVHIVPQ